MKKWTIFKWFHYSTFIPKIVSLKKCAHYINYYTIQFDDSCRYEINEPSCVNKLFGHSFHIFNFHKNSVRFGWSYNKESDNIIIWTYTYINGKLHKKQFAACDFNIPYYFSIITNLPVNTIVYNFNNQQTYSEKFNSLTPKFLLTLGYYFGGKSRAPHKMFIQYKK